MIQNTSNKPISELFSADNSVSYKIPKYQREYVWNKTNWEALFDDIEESNGGHFMGSIICINTQKDSLKPAMIELVDGQQRMTTISIFYLAIYKFLKNNLPDENDMNSRLELLSLRNRIILSETSSLRLTPSHSNNNHEDYKWIFTQEIPEIKTVSKPRNLGNRQISKAFHYFYKRLAEVNEENKPTYTYDSVKKLLNKLNSATLVKIDVASHADAFTLFETLNNRGVPLSAIDLIKNKLLGHLEKHVPHTNIDVNFDRWNQIIKNLTEDYNVQERFLRQFYNAFKWDKVIEVEKKPKALRSNLIAIFEELINRDVNEIFNRLEEAAEIYSKNIQYEIEEHSEELIQGLRNLENVNGADGYMLLMFIEKRFKINEKHKVDLVNYLCKYFIRRNVTDTPPTRDLTNYFMDMIESTNGLVDYNFEVVKRIICEKGKPANDELFKQKLKGNLYEENVGATRYILTSIELAETLTKERYTNFYSRNKNIFVWTVEHIFPQGDNIPEEWIQMMGNGSIEQANEIKKSHVHKLGNLTLTAYNSNLSNLSLSKKQDRKNSEGKFIGFRNGLSINEDIKSIDVWTKEAIEQRTEKLVLKALEIFML
jgi:uncharacterized protein with ParB-like and HNH nuclease domain